jgi:hypothetical protein
MAYRCTEPIPGICGPALSGTDRRRPTPVSRLGLLRGLTFLLGPFLAAACSAADPGTDAALTFTQITIDESPPPQPYYKMLGDLNNDGRIDLLVAGRRGPLVSYMAPDWQKREIAPSGWDGVNGATADLDADGDVDVVMGGVIWLSNPLIEGHTEWTIHRIDQRRAHDVEVADFNGDGRLDVAARDQSAFGKSGNWVALYVQADNGTWHRREWECPHGEGLKAGDLDQDGDVDLVVGPLWFANPGDGSFSEAHRHPLTSSWQEPDTKVELADFNGDGRPDVVLAPAELRGETHKVAWYAGPVNPASPEWTEHIVVPEIECVVHALGTGDFDGDSDSDLALAEMHQGADADEVTVLLNSAAGQSWQKLVLGTRGSHDLVVGDLDGDGDLDLLGANHADEHPLLLWRNERLAPETPPASTRPPH